MSGDEEVDELGPEYDFSQMVGGVRGKYAEAAGRGTHVVRVTGTQPRTSRERAAPAIDDDLAAELLALQRRDTEMRRRLKSGELFAGYAPEMERVHLENACALAAVLDRVGWPGADRVGAEAAEAAWLVAQHAISWPTFQRRCLDLLAAVVEEGRAPRWHLANLTDRVRFNERRPQVYGTIHDWDAAGEMSPWPVEDPERVDERRRTAGLPPLHEVTFNLRSRARAEGDASSERFVNRQREIEAWARRVGWIGSEDPRGSGGDR